MDVETAHAIADYLADEGVDAQVSESYSGRGMYGDTTAALVVNGVGDLPLVGWAAAQLDVDPSDLPQRTDQMGLGMVVY